MNKEKKKELLIVIFLGPFGVHKFLKGEIRMGIIYLFTVGLFFIGWIKDIIITVKKNDEFNDSTSPIEKLPNIEGTNLNLLNDEICCYMDKAYTFKDKVITTGYKGKNSGFSIRLSKGFSFHTGGSGSKAIKTKQRTIYNGILYLTTKRIIYTSQGECFDKTFDKITLVQETKSGLMIQIGPNTYSITTKTHSKFMRLFNYLRQIQSNDLEKK